MDILDASGALLALSQPTRLAAFRHLVGALPVTLAAGEIARRCGVPHNTMSSHLNALMRVGLIAVQRDGRAMNYRADLDRFRALMLFLMKDCCAGRSEICAPLIADLACCIPTQAEPVTHG